MAGARRSNGPIAERRPYIMGILNVTPDSFSDGGLYRNFDDAVDHAVHLFEQGANIIFTHPAPNHSPWAIMKPEDQAGFKQALVTYDKVLDENTNDILKATRSRDWMAATGALSQLQVSCVSCHAQWKDKAQKWPAQLR